MNNVLASTILPALLLTPGLQAVKITTSDGEEFEYTRKIDIAALHHNKAIEGLLTCLSDVHQSDAEESDSESITVEENDLEDSDVEASDAENNDNEEQDSRNTSAEDQEPIELSRVDSLCWQKIMHCSQLLHAMKNLAGDDKKEKQEELHNTLAGYNRNELYAFINGVDYLNNQKLFTLALEQWLTHHIPDLFKTNNKMYRFNHTITAELQKKITHCLRTWCETDIALFTEDRKKLIAHNELLNHTNNINAMCYSPDGRYIAFTSNDTTIRIWDVTTKTLLHTLIGHTQTIKAICYSPDGRRLASSSFDCTIRIWDTHTGTLLQTLPGRRRCRATSVCYSPNGNHLVSVEPKGSTSVEPQDSLCIWDVHTATLLYTLTGHAGSIHAMCYSPSGDCIAGASDNGAVYIWDVHTRALLHTLPDNTGSVNAICYSPDGNCIAATSKDRAVRIWNAHTGALLHTLHDSECGCYCDCEAGYCQCGPCTCACRSVCYSPDGNYIAWIVSGRGYTTRPEIHIWDIHTRTPLHCLSLPSQDCFDSICYSPQGNHLAVTHYSNTIGAWDFTQTKQLIAMKAKQFIDQSSDDQRLLLYLAFKKKHKNKTLALDTLHLLQPFAQFDYDTQNIIHKALPLKISLERSLVLRAYEHRNKLAWASLAALGYLNPALGGLGTLGYLVWKQQQR